jgi:hypothetical protein
VIKEIRERARQFGPTSAFRVPAHKNTLKQLLVTSAAIVGAAIAVSAHDSGATFGCTAPWQSALHLLLPRQATHGFRRDPPQG